MNSLFPSASNYTDIQGLQALKNAADKNSPEALHEAAKQFEALFIQSLLKSMRAAKLDDGLLDSEQSDFYLDMYDKQLALSLTRRNGIGLANMLYEQLKHTLPVQRNVTPAMGAALVAEPAAVNVAEVAPVSLKPPQPLRAMINTSSVPGSRVTDNAVNPLDNAIERGNKSSPATPANISPAFQSVRDFVTTLWPFAKQVAQKLGTHPGVLLAQAALETGWGKYILRNTRGESSFNLFNIKAKRDWRGPVISRNTLEYLDGRYQRRDADFKVYDSFAHSFQDYLDHIRSSENYRSAIQNAGSPRRFTQALQRAGYATDPEYSQKILRILESEKMKAAIGNLKLSNQ